MQRKRYISGSVLLWSLVFQLLLAASCTQTQRQEATPANNGGGQREKAADTKSTASPSEDKSSVTTYDGLQLTVLSIERMKEKEVLPGFPEKMRAKKGYELAMVQLRVKVSAAGKKLDVTQLELRDARENKYRCALVRTNLCDAKPGEETTCELPFLVPEGVTLTKLQVGAEFIDLAKVEKR